MGKWLGTIGSPGLHCKGEMRPDRSDVAQANDPPSQFGITEIMARIPG